MNIKSAQFVKGVTGPDPVFEDGIPQFAFIGRSNVGKSSLINSLTKQKNLARTSSFPGRTQQVNLFLINKSFYIVDLPGYGYAKTSQDKRDELKGIIRWYLFESGYEQQKVVFIIDAFVGVTESDLEVLRMLQEHRKNIVVIANKVDKIKKSEYVKRFRVIEELVGHHKIIPYSSTMNMKSMGGGALGTGNVANEIFGVL
jgi:GTP-binding protein